MKYTQYNIIKIVIKEQVKLISLMTDFTIGSQTSTV